jgi:hypothetical protein
MFTEKMYVKAVGRTAYSFQAGLAQVAVCQLSAAGFDEVLPYSTFKIKFTLSHNYYFNLSILFILLNVKSK